tara:strand:+ start:5667 stop:5789 length:123 start_codon:yes stop_codon:yes gene_type:complete
MLFFMKKRTTIVFKILDDIKVSYEKNNTYIEYEWFEQESL